MTAIPNNAVANIKNNDFPGVQSNIVANRPNEPKSKVKTRNGIEHIAKPFKGIEENRIIRFIVKISLKTLNILLNPYFEKPYLRG